MMSTLQICLWSCPRLQLSLKKSIGNALRLRSGYRCTLGRIARHKSGRSKIELQTTHFRQNDSIPRRDKSSSKDKSTRRDRRPHTCSYEHCRRSTTHKTDECLFAKLAVKIGTESWRRQGDASPIVLGQ